MKTFESYRITTFHDRQPERSEKIFIGSELKELRFSPGGYRCNVFSGTGGNFHKFAWPIQTFTNPTKFAELYKQLRGKTKGTR